MILYPTPPYDFARTVEASRHLYAMGERRSDVYRRAIHVGESLALIEVASVGTVADPALDLRLLASRGVVDSAALEAKARRVFNLADDLTPFYAYARTVPALWATVEPLYGLHTLQADSVFEGLALTIIEQQIALRMAQTAERWLLAWADESITYEGATYYAFPRPAQIAAATVADLTPLKITFARMQRLIDVARAITAGELDLEALRDQPVESVYEALMALKGVGHWTAAWTITRALGVYGYVGAADVALRAAVNHYYYGATGRAERALVDQTFAAHGSFDGTAAFYTLMRWATERY